MSRPSDCPASNQNAEHLHDCSQSRDVGYPGDEISVAKAAPKALTARGYVLTAPSTMKQVLPGREIWRHMSLCSTMSCSDVMLSEAIIFLP